MKSPRQGSVAFLATTYASSLTHPQLHVDLTDQPTISPGAIHGDGRSLALRTARPPLPRMVIRSAMCGRASLAPTPAR